MKTILAILTGILCVFTSNAQNKALKQIEGAAEKKIEAQDFNTTRNNRERGNYQPSKSASEQAVPAPAPAPAAKQESSGETNKTPAIEGGYDAQYTFHTQLNYKFENFSNTAQNQNLKYFFGDNCVQIAMGHVNSGSIYDGKNNSMILLNHTEKTATVMSMKTMEAVMSQNKTTTSEATAKVVKTGRTKVILGYNCQEYVIEGAQKSEIWVSTEPGIDVSSEFTKISKNFTSKIPKETFENGGVMMEYTQYNSSGKAETHLIITNLKKETSSFKLEDYLITSM